MKKFIQKIQSLGQRAAELKEAVQGVPPKVAGIREAVALTTGQLKELGVQVQNSIVGLKADQEDQLLTALRDINDSTGIIRQAGFELGGVDLELSPIQRLIVHLNRREDVRTSVLEALRDASKARPTVHALLTSLVKAEETADSVHMTDLEYHALIVHIGPTPAVRLCWQPSAPLAPVAKGSVLAASSAVATEAPEVSPERPSFFGATAPDAEVLAANEASKGDDQTAEAGVPEASAPPAAPRKPEPKPRSATAPPPITTTVSAPPEASGRKTAPPVWNSDALERFKTMPKASKYRR